MKPLVILAHPNIADSRINRRLIEEVRNYPEITVHELYSSYPDWVIDVPREQELLENHDRIVLQFPLYWYSTPPLLKKWQDDVLSYGWAYGSQGKKCRCNKVSVN
jgi:putative NADPH-quinone reductase